MAALLGAQRSTLGSGGRSDEAPVPTCIGTAGRGRLARANETRPQIVDVFPVPGGLYCVSTGLLWQSDYSPLDQ